MISISPEVYVIDYIYRSTMYQIDKIVGEHLKNRRSINYRVDIRLPNLFIVGFLQEVNIGCTFVDIEYGGG